MCEGYLEKETQRFRREWERERWSTFHLVLIQLDKKSRRKLRKPTDLVTFEWEKDFTTPDYTRAEYDKLIERFGQSLN